MEDKVRGEKEFRMNIHAEKPKAMELTRMQPSLTYSWKEKLQTKWKVFDEKSEVGNLREREL